MRRRRTSGRKTGLATGSLALLALFGSASATGDRRLISLYHIHTKERLDIVYKEDGRYVPEAMAKIDWFLRDWRTNQKTTIAPETIDVAWEMHRELGSREPIHIISGYRSKGTNEMLRKTRGGQASQSQHITGKAIDIAFPDVPIRRLRYSAMIRERGGVGYYPTSAIPFVHVDTARVRHWPRMLHDELAMLFPNGSRHRSADGRAVSRGDAAEARKRNPELAQQVAQFFDIRSGAKSAVALASAEPPPAGINTSAETLPWASKDKTSPAAPILAQAPQPARRPEFVAASTANAPQEAPKPRQVAALEPATGLVWEASPRPPAPKLLAAPRPVERSSTFKPGISATDRQSLDKLVTLASYAPDEMAARPNIPAAPRLVAEPQPVARPASAPPVTASIGQRISLDPVTNPEAAPAPLPPAAIAELSGDTGTDGIGRFSKPAAWITGPEYDEDHPDELAYQPFPIAAFLTKTASPDDPALTRLIAPDVAKTLDMLDGEGSIQPMRFRPGLKTAKLLWAQEFKGGAVDLATLEQLSEPDPPRPTAVAGRNVKTSQR